MGLWFEITRVAAALNVVLLLGLGSVWVRNYYHFRSKHTLGLSVFAVLMLAENALALYYFTVDPMTSAWFPQTPEVPQVAMMVLRILMTVAFVFLVWVTWD